MREKLAEARDHLDEAIKGLDLAHRTWSEYVTSLHMAELNLQQAQQRIRRCYNAVLDVLNGDG
jgi:exonuclease VII small subunit